MASQNCLLCKHCMVIDMANKGTLLKIICDLFGLSDIKRAVSCADYNESEFLRKIQTCLSDPDAR